eukprot:TRINITY_DN10298_c0_g2_i4.p1 TRINITY_DN10298_c0_g2~~TRINITY_DN10298_c0_g2_i4.p1  ORF type:complete len:518 (-),score=47.42 TRINITY_DN10298_c0_g2_i4:1292-2845(-)
MLEQELKNKISNTINQYKLKCHQLEDEIHVLKSAIYQLSLLPHSFHASLEEPIHNLRINLKENKGSQQIKKSVDSLAHAMTHLKERKELSSLSLTDFIKQETDLLSRVAITDKERKVFRKAEQSIKKESDEQLLLEKFNKLLESSVSAVTKQLIHAQHHLSEKEEPNKLSSYIDDQINSRLNQLLEHVLIPEDLASKLQSLKSRLKGHLTSHSLTEVVNSLTDLVIEAFNLEHDQFKEFLNRFADYLHDFGQYLDLTHNHNQANQQETEAFEGELQNRTQQIESALCQTKTIEELTQKIENGLKGMGNQIRNYREKGHKRTEEYNEKIMVLQNKLEEVEDGAEKIRNHLSSHKVRINHDSLTGLPNHTAYEEYIVGAFHRWQRGLGELSLALVEVDTLKLINNEYGHVLGDKALKKIATTLKSSIRAADFIARFSGETFILVFERTSAYYGAKLLENLRAAVVECEFSCHDEKISIVPAFALTTLKHGDTLETFFTRAKQAIEKAKQNEPSKMAIIK